MAKKSETTEAETPAGSIEVTYSAAAHNELVHAVLFHSNPYNPQPALMEEIWQALKGGDQTASVKAWIGAMDLIHPEQSKQ
jgi:hypothetical protein